MFSSVHLLSFIPLHQCVLSNSGRGFTLMWFLGGVSGSEEGWQTSGGRVWNLRRWFTFDHIIRGLLQKPLKASLRAGFDHICVGLQTNKKSVNVWFGPGAKLLQDELKPAWNVGVDHNSTIKKESHWQCNLLIALLFDMHLSASFENFWICSTQFTHF